MIKKLLFLSMLLTTNVVAWAQTFEFTSSDEGQTLTISASGDLTSLPTFATELKEKIKSGSYSKVEFVNTNTAAPLLINKTIVNAICYDGYSYITSVKTLDLGQATLPGLNANVFTKDDGQSWQVNNISISDLTLPLVPADANGDIVVPSNVISCYTTNAVVPGCDQLKTVRIPAGYTKLDENAFKGLKSVANFILPTTIKEIGNSAFEDTGSITSMNLNEGLTYIGKRAFMGTSLTEMTFPSTLDKIDDGAFANIVSYKQIILNDGLRFIGNGAFCRAEAETQEVLDIPASVKYIGPGAFGFRYYRDVVYHSTIAPISPLGNNCINTGSGNQNISCFYADMYMGNNGNQSATSETYPLADNNNCSTKLEDGTVVGYGYANRENYQNGDEYFAMLHFPSDLSIDQYDTYKDHTRIYLSANYTTAFAFNSSSATTGVVVPLPAGVDKEIGKTYNGSSYGPGGDGLYNRVTSGYWDTYRGEQYIWPSQNQWMRAFIEASCGYNWDGVTKYRPTLTPEQIALMVEDGEVCINGVAVDLSASTTLTEADANAYNATLPGAWNSTTVKTPTEYYSEEEINEHNADKELNPGAVAVGDVLYYTQQEIDEHNANFEGAKHEGDVETPGQPARELTYEEWCALPGVLDWMKGNESEWLKSRDNWIAYNGAPNYKIDAIDAVLYTAETAAAYNAEHNPDAWSAPKEKGIVETTEQANEYNASLPNAWTAETVKTPAVYYTEAEINEHNASLDGHKTAGESSPNAELYADGLSMIAYMGTRQFVFADADGQTAQDPETPIKKTYTLPMEGHHWWTLCVPFNMTKKEIDETFGEGTHVCLFSGVDRKVTEEEKSIALKFQHDVYAHKTVKVKDMTTGTYVYAANFSKDAAPAADDDIVIYAHEAYMIWPTLTNDDAVFVVNDYQTVPGSPVPTLVKANADDESADADHTEYRYIGNYIDKISVETETNGPEGRAAELATVKVPAYSYVYAKKKTQGIDDYKFWFIQNNKSTWKPNKCIVQATAKDGGLVDNNSFFGSNTTPAKQTSLFGEVDEEETTAIENVIIIAGDGENSEIVYSVNGQIVNPNAIGKGIFIKNGKKFVNK